MTIVATIRRSSSDEVRDAATGALPAGALAAAGFVDEARWVATAPVVVADGPVRIQVRSATSRQFLAISCSTTTLTLQAVTLKVTGLTILTDQWAVGNLDVDLPAGGALVWIEGEDVTERDIWPGRVGVSVS